MREHQISAQAQSWTPESLPYELDFVETGKLISERGYLAENIFNVGSLYDEEGTAVMEDLV